MALVTGEGLDKYLQQFARRESAELFEQRKAITQHVTPAILKNILDVFYKVPRARYSTTIGHRKSAGGSALDEKVTADLKAVLGKFWGTAGLSKWLAARYLEMNATDPNAFVVVEFEPTDGVKMAQPYPFEVSSHDAIDFQHTNRVLDYLIARQAKEVEDGGKKADRYRYTMYLDNDTIVLDPLPVNGGPPRTDEKQISVWNSLQVIWLDREPYSLTIPAPHNIGRVPAFRVGYNRDLYTRGNTFVAPYESAVPLLKKTLKINSEHDLAMTLTAHPYQIRYADPCDAQGCFKGYLHDNTVCTACHGTGRKSITSGQEELVLDLPKVPEDILDLTKLLVFVTPPIDVLKFQEEAISKIAAAAIKTVFNSDIFDRAEIAETATGKNIALQNVYDTLYTMAEAYADTWVFVVDIVARIIDRHNGLIAIMKFPRDFKMKDLRELFDDLKAADESGAGPEVIRAIQSQIVGTVMVDDQQEMQRYIVRERLNPFTGLSKEEILVAINSDLTPKRVKVLYLNMGTIFDIIEETTGAAFYDLNPQRQRELVNAQVQLIISEMEIEADFGSPLFSTSDGSGATGASDVLGKVPLALQQLALARERALESKDAALAAQIGRKMDELLEKI